MYSNTLKVSLLIIVTAIGTSCKSNKKIILKNNTVYQYIKNPNIQNDEPGKVIEYKTTKRLRTKITDKTTYYSLDDIKEDLGLTKVDSLWLDEEDSKKYASRDSQFYTHETSTLLDSNYQKGEKFSPKGFSYLSSDFVLSAMTTALKYRNGIGNELINPPTVETGFNVNFAPGFRLNRTTFNPTRKFLGRNIHNYSLTAVGLFGIGATGLNQANAPSILSNRNKTMITGGFGILLAVNEIGIGYTFGWDHIPNNNNINWIYQGQMWQGVSIKIDLIKL